MDIILFGGDSYLTLRKRLKTVLGRLKAVCGNAPAKEKWLDNQQVCLLLGVSKRTLQSFRDKGLLAFSRIRHKCYYKESDVKALTGKRKNNWRE